GVGRTRTRSLGTSAGTAVSHTKSGTVIDSRAGDGVYYTQTMHDIHGDPKPYPDHAMDTDLKRYDITPLNGDATTSNPTSWVTTYTNYVSNISYPLTHQSTNVSAISSADANLAAARSNPSRASLVPLTLLQDVVDLPKMIRDVGRTFKKPRSLMSAKELASHNLAAQFGWLPLIKDVQDLLDFGHTVHKRAGELRKLYDRGWIGRTIQLDHDSIRSHSSSDARLDLGTSGVPHITVSYDTITSVSKWASVRWKLTTAPPYNPSDAEVLKQARRLASGLTPEGLAAGVWEVLPWTWLTDWFTHTGDYIRSNSNTIPATLTSCCVMKKSTTSRIYTRTDSTSSVTGGGGTVTIEAFDRQLKSPSLSTARFPHLSGKSLSILGSLFIQRAK
ncbi:TPA_asm: maturation protein, partial [ssRNA phage Gerhypos.4_43]